MRPQRSLDVVGKVRVKSRVSADPVKGLPVAPALAKELAKLGFSFDVEVVAAK